MSNKTPSGYAFPVAANPETVHFLTLPMEERRKIGYGPSCITDADQAAASKILAGRRAGSHPSIKTQPLTPAGIEHMKRIL